MYLSLYLQGTPNKMRDADLGHPDYTATNQSNRVGYSRDMHKTGTYSA